MPRGEFKHRYWFFADTLQTSHGLLALFEKIYYGVRPPIGLFYIERDPHSRTEIEERDTVLSA